jgi:IS66 C-terminal element
LRAATGSRHGVLFRWKPELTRAAPLFVAVEITDAIAGSDGGTTRWAVVASLLATAKLNDVEPFAYLKDVLERMSNGHPMSKLDDLLPWNWTLSNPQSTTDV